MPDPIQQASDRTPPEGPGAPVRTESKTVGLLIVWLSICVLAVALETAVTRLEADRAVQSDSQFLEGSSTFSEPLDRLGGEHLADTEELEASRRP